MQSTAILDPSTPSLAGVARELRERARSYCESSAVVNSVVADAYRRRAAELALVAWVGELRAGSSHSPHPLDCVA